MTFKQKTSVIALIALAVIGASALPANAATNATPAPKPSITGAPGAGGFGDGAGAQAFAKYAACLAKAGIKLPAFGGGRGFGAPGTRPTDVRPSAGSFGGTPRPRPTFSLTPAQQKAFTACAAFRPSFGGFRPDDGGINPGAIAPGTTKLGGGSTSTTPKTGSSAAYFACLKAHGLPVTTVAQVAGLDTQNPKVIAALKACAGK